MKGSYHAGIAFLFLLEYPLKRTYLQLQCYRKSADSIFLVFRTKRLPSNVIGEQVLKCLLFY